MISIWRQLWLLLWKGIMIKKRQKIWLALELIIPVLLFAILVLVRTRDFYVSYPPCHYDAKALPSSGILPFAQSLLCSFMNRCYASPTTGDDTNFINTNSTKQSLLTTGAREWAQLMAMIGSNRTLWSSRFDQLIDLIESIGGSPQTIAHLLTDPIPIYKFFDSNESAIEFIEILTDADKGFAGNLLSAAITPLFALKAYQEITTKIEMKSVVELPLSDEKFDFLCNETTRKSGILMPSGVDEPEKLCEITLGRLALATAFGPLHDRFDDMEPKKFKDVITSATLNQTIPTKNGTASVKDHDINGIIELINDILSNGAVMNIFSTLQSVNFSDPTSISNAIFCQQNPLDTVNQDTIVKKVISSYSMFEEDTNRMYGFLRGVTPGRDEHDHGDRKYCGNIPIQSESNCTILETTFMRKMKQLFVGYLLVGPDSAPVRAIVDKLNEPLRWMNLLRDSVIEFNQISPSLQDSLSQSDLVSVAESIKQVVNILNSTHLVNESLLIQIDEFLSSAFESSNNSSSLLMSIRKYTLQLENLLKCFLMDRIVIVSNETEMVDRALCLMDYQQYFSGIYFLDIDANSTHFPSVVQYKIRHPPDFVDGTSGRMDGSRHSMSRDSVFVDLKYLTYGFSFLQDAIERALIELATGRRVKTGLFAQQEPYPCSGYDRFKVTNFLAIFVILSWMIPSSMLVKNIVYEKEMRLKEMMRIMGLGDAVHWLAWAAQSFTLNLVSIIVISVLLKYGQIMPNTDLTLLMVFFTLFAVSTITQCVFFSTLFSQANIATASSALLFYLLFFPYQISARTGWYTFTLITLLFPQSAVGYGFIMLYNAELDGIAHWADLTSIYVEPLQLWLSTVMIAFAADAVIYCLLAWYVSAVFPGSYGIPQPFYFFLTKRYWFSNGHNEMRNSTELKHTMNGNIYGLPNESDFESEPSELKLAVDVQNLVKVYGNNTKALDSLNIRFYESQITAFLGHNGAGKTTAMSVLTGLYKPTSGTAFVYGMDIRTHMAAIRDCLGMCPQHNVLFDKLNVEEQLQFYGGLKGLRGDSLNTEVESMLTDIGLESKRDQIASDLSGGMKRKLCIGIALMGGSKLVILDEPTAGIDAHARRSIWHLLLKHKQGRTMILSTHHMDEADVLADRIAIIVEGSLRTAGSSLFLKKRFGDGIHLNVLKNQDDVDRISMNNRIETFIMERSNERSELMDDMGDELVFRLPIDMDAKDLKRFIFVIIVLWQCYVL